MPGEEPEVFPFGSAGSRGWVIIMNEAGALLRVARQPMRLPSKAHSRAAGFSKKHRGDFYLQNRRLLISGLRKVAGNTFCLAITSAMFSAPPCAFWLTDPPALMLFWMSR